jgi:insertion element IS1 protein InsB
MSREDPICRRATLRERILPEEVEHWLSKAGNQRIERTNGIIRQQNGRWHRRQNKFGKIWE